MKVWIVEDCPPYESGTFLGVYATEELAQAAALRQASWDFIAVWGEDVVTELPPSEPAKKPYQVIP